MKMTATLIFTFTAATRFIIIPPTTPSGTLSFIRAIVFATATGIAQSTLDIGATAMIRILITTPTTIFIPTAIGRQPGFTPGRTGLLILTMVTEGIETGIITAVLTHHTLRASPKDAILAGAPSIAMILRIRHPLLQEPAVALRRAQS